MWLSHRSHIVGGVASDWCATSGDVSCEGKYKHVSTHDHLLMRCTCRGERDYWQDNENQHWRNARPISFGPNSLSCPHSRFLFSIKPIQSCAEEKVSSACAWACVRACSKCFALCELWPSEGNRRNIFPPEARVVSEMSVFLNNFNPGDRGQGILLWTNVL